MKESFFTVIQKKIRFRLRHFFYYHFSFSPFGFIVFVLTLLLLFRALFVRNAYEIIFSSAVLCLMLIMFVQGKWKSSKYKDFKAAWKPPSPYIAELCNNNGERGITSEESIITGLDVSVSLFFRLHFIVRGNYYLLGSVNSLYVSAETSFSRGEETARLQLDFPMSGYFACEFFCRIHDIFGFYSFPCGVPQQKIVRVRSAPFFGKKNYLTAMSRAEDTHSKTSMSEERYYMREYAPGDRLRDINWKSSEKLDILVTRISPDNQEKISHLEIYFRNYGSEDIASLEALWLLDRAKARLSHFLNSIHDEHPAHIFHVHSAQCSWEIKNTDELESFLDELAVLSFSPSTNEMIHIDVHAKNDLYVFSTAYDTELNSFLAACNHRSVSLFFVQFPVNRKEKEKPESEKFLIRNFFLKNYHVLHFKLFNRRNKQQTVSSGAVTAVSNMRAEIIYAETKW